jgi:hypothetical protein
MIASGFTPPPLPPPVPLYSKPTSTLANIFASNFFNRSSSPAPTPVEPPQPSPPEDPLEVTILSREIQIYQADIKVSVSTSFGKELERATKKPPPTRMPASLVFSRGDEDDETTEVGVDGMRTRRKDTGGVFSGLCPALDRYVPCG